MRTIGLASLLLGSWTLAGCATTGPMLGYTDNNLFVIEHHDPERGGRIVGTVCAVDVQLQAYLRKDGVLISGLVADRHASTEGVHSEDGRLVPSPASSELPYHVEVRDRARTSERVLTGMIGDEETLPDERVSAPHTVELTLTRDRISGQLGARHFDLRARGEDYIGSLTINGIAMPYVVRGRGQLWQMPAAAQASILPLLLTCSEPTKVIQMVDLRQSTLPDLEPPAWMALPYAAPTMPMAPALGSPPPPSGGDPNPSLQRSVASLRGE